MPPVTHPEMPWETPSGWRRSGVRSICRGGHREPALPGKRRLLVSLLHVRKFPNNPAEGIRRGEARCQSNRNGSPQAIHHCPRVGCGQGRPLRGPSKGPGEATCAATAARRPLLVRTALGWPCSRRLCSTCAVGTGTGSRLARHSRKLAFADEGGLLVRFLHDPDSPVCLRLISKSSPPFHPTLHRVGNAAGEAST